VAQYIVPSFHAPPPALPSQRVWQAKFEKFSERIAQEDPLAVEVILKAVEKESEGTAS